MSTAIRAQIGQIVTAQPVIDMHTHLYPPTFGTPLSGAGDRAEPDGLMLWGIDELLTYHYLVAELFRVVEPAELGPEQFFGMDKNFATNGYYW